MHLFSEMITQDMTKFVKNIDTPACICITLFLFLPHFGVINYLADTLHFGLTVIVNLTYCIVEPPVSHYSKFAYMDRKWLLARAHALLR